MLFVVHLITINSYQRIKERPQKGVSFKTKIVVFASYNVFNFQP